MILEGSSLESGFLAIGPLNVLEQDILLRFTANGEVHFLEAVLDFLSQIFPLIIIFLFKM